MYFVIEDTDPLWLETRVNTRQEGTWLRPPGLAGACSLSPNWLRPTVVWEHKWGECHI